MKKHTLFNIGAPSSWLRALLPILILSLAVLSCKKDEGGGGEVTPPEPEPVKTKLTVLVFHPYCTLKEALQEDYKEIIANIQKNGCLPELQLMHLTSKDTEDYYLIETKVSEKTYQNDTIKRYRFSQLDYTTLEGMKTILNDVKGARKCDTLAMVIGSHGSGWIPYPEKTEKKQSSAKKKAFGSGERYNSKYVMHFQTLTAALQASQLNLKFLALDCCNSQNIENAYNLRHITRWVIASPAEILSDGMPYKTDFNKLFLGDYTGFAKAFVEYYRKKGEEATCSVVDTEKFDDLLKVMRAINDQYYIDNISRVQQEANKRDIQPLGGYTTTPPDFQDFQDYVYHLCDNEQLRKDFDAALSKLVVWKDATDYFYWEAYVSGGKRYKLSVYSGITNSEAISKYSKYMQETEWYKATHSN